MFQISRRGRKLNISDDPRTLVSLPKDVPERIWAEILQKEENDLIILDIREEIIDGALNICYQNYMEKQNAFFTANCCAKAWLKLIDWYFYRHDPGEEPSAYPPCFIPKREESWFPDKMPDPSPKDTWCRQVLEVGEDVPPEDTLRKWPSDSSLNYPVIEEIPEEYWFPGKVCVSDDGSRLSLSHGYRYGRRKPLLVRTCISGVWKYVQESETPSSSGSLAAPSELLQRVTDYTDEELVQKESTVSALKTTTPVEGSEHGAGDSTFVETRNRRKSEKIKSFSRASVSRSRGGLPPLNKDSKMSVISDCRLRNLRLDTQYEISSEKVDSPLGEIVRRK